MNVLKWSAAAGSLLLASVLASCGVGSNVNGTSNATAPGRLDWALRIGGVGSSTTGGGVASHSDGGCTIFGQYEAPITFAPGTTQEVVLQPGPGPSVFLARYGPAGVFIWAQSIVATQYVTAWDIAELLDGGTVVSGFYAGDATFAQDAPGETTILSPGDEAGFVAVYERNGAMRYVRRITGPLGVTESLGVCAVRDGGFAVTGLFQTEVTVGEGDPEETTLLASGEVGAFVARYRINGILVWARAIEAADGYATGWAVAALGSEGIAVAGEWQGTVAAGLGEANETAIPSVGSEDLWISRYNLDGLHMWTRAVQGADEDEVHSLAGDHEGNVRLTGYFRNATTVDGAVPVPLTSAGNTDGFLAAYTVTGELGFALRFGGLGEDAGYGVRLLPNGGAIVTGRIVGEVSLSSVGNVDFVVGTPGSTSSDVLVAEWSALGQVLWATTAGGPGEDIAVSVDRQVGASHFFVAGLFDGTAVFGAGQANETTLTATGATDAFLARFSD